MPLRITKHKKLIPGVRLNINKGGPSVTLGGLGVHKSFGRKGTSTSAGIPGTGVYYTKRTNYRNARKGTEVMSPETMMPGHPDNPAQRGVPWIDNSFAWIGRHWVIATIVVIAFVFLVTRAG